MQKEVQKNILVKVPEDLFNAINLRVLSGFENRQQLCRQYFIKGLIDEGYESSVGQPIVLRSKTTNDGVPNTEE
jgi:hypothetical protein